MTPFGHRPGRGPGATPAPGGGEPAVRLRARAWLLLVASSLLGLVAFVWPLFASASGSAELAHRGDAPWIFVMLLPLLLAIVVAELAEGALDAKAIALLGVLAACGAALRLPGGGAAGFEPVFFLLIPAGRVLGRGFGFVLGALTLFASALLTGGVGPWLPFQMFGAAWIGFFAGCLPPARGRAEIALLAGYAAVASLAYGLLLNLWFWPFAISEGTQLSFVPGDGVVANLQRFWAFHLATSLGFDLPRAVFTVLFVVLAGRPVLGALRRVSRRAAFGAPATFEARPAPAVAIPGRAAEGAGGADVVAAPGGSAVGG